MSPSGEKRALTKRRAIFVYEAARLQAEAAGAPIVSEPWAERDEAFRSQFLDVIEMMCGPNRKADPEELHDLPPLRLQVARGRAAVRTHDIDGPGEAT